MSLYFFVRSKMRRVFCIVNLAIAALAVCSSSYAQQRTLSIYVIDINREPVEGVVISTQGDGSQSDPTDNSGRTHIILPVGTKPNDVVFFQLVRGLKTNADWDIINGERALVPPFDAKPSSFVTVMVINRYDKQFLANRNYLNSFGGVSQKLKSSEKSAEANERSGELDQRTREYSLEEAAQAARLLQSQEAELSLQKHHIVNKTVSLAQSYYAEGRYHESVTAFREAVRLRPDDLKILSEFAAALEKDKSYAEAELIYEKVVTTLDQMPEVNHSETLILLEGYLAVLRQMKHETKLTEVEARIKVVRAKLSKQAMPR